MHLQREAGISGIKLTRKGDTGYLSFGSAACTAKSNTQSGAATASKSNGRGRSDCTRRKALVANSHEGLCTTNLTLGSGRKKDAAPVTERICVSSYSSSTCTSRATFVGCGDHKKKCSCIESSCVSRQWCDVLKYEKRSSQYTHRSYKARCVEPHPFPEGVAVGARTRACLQHVNVFFADAKLFELSKSIRMKLCIWYEGKARKPNILRRER